MITSWEGLCFKRAPGISQPLKGELCSCDVPAEEKASKPVRTVINMPGNEMCVFFVCFFCNSIHYLLHTAELSFSKWAVFDCCLWVQDLLCLRSGAMLADSYHRLGCHRWAVQAATSVSEASLESVLKNENNVLFFVVVFFVVHFNLCFDYCYAILMEVQGRMYVFRETVEYIIFCLT